MDCRFVICDLRFVKLRSCAGIIIAVLAVCLPFLVSCSKQNGSTVVVYASQDEVFAEPIFKDFEKQTGIKVLPVYDSEAVKTVGLANRLLAEASHPQCDVFWNNEELRTRELAARNVFRETNGWALLGYRSRRMVVNTNLLPVDKAPHSFSVLNRARCDDVQPHAGIAPFDRQHFDEDVYACFSRADMGLQRDGPERMRGRNGDNRCPGLPQMFVRGTAGVERAKQVDIDHRLETVCGHPERRSRKITGRSADQNIDLAIAIPRLPEDALEGLVFAHVGGEAHRFATRFSNARCRLIQLFLRAAYQCHLGAVLGETLRYAQTDAAAASCHQRDFIPQQVIAKNTRRLHVSHFARSSLSLQ